VSRILLFTKVPPVMSTFWIFAKRAEPESNCQTANGKWFKQLTDILCSDFVDTCIMASGTEGNNGLWVVKDMCVGGVSNLWSLAEPSRLGTSIINPVTSTEIGGPGDSAYSSVANTVVGA